MSKFTDEFVETYGDTTRLRKITKELRCRNEFNKKMKEANMNITKITQGKLGRSI